MDKQQYMLRKHEESLSSEPVDRDAAHAAFANLYDTLGWKAPEVIWTQSPMGAAFVAGVMILVETTPDISAPAANWSEPNTDIVSERTTAEGIWRSLMGALPHLGSLASGAGSGLSEMEQPDAKPSESDSTVRRIAYHLCEVARHRLDDEDADTAWLAKLVTLAAHPGSNEIWARLLAGISEASWEFMYGAHDISWLGHYQYEHEHEGKSLTDELLALIEASRHAGWWISMEDFVVASERHHYIHFDDNDRLHAQGGPCVEYPDGWKVWAWHNVRIEPEDAWIVEKPESITAQDIMTESNQEMRRIKLNLMGLDRYLQQANATLIDDQYPEWGKLWRAPLPDSRTETDDLWMVQVRNSTPEPDGTYKDYFLRVDPRGYGGDVAKDAHAAVAWTFVDDETGDPVFEDWREYAPAQET